MPGTLYVVATPIGNLEDITLRALSTLKSVSLIAAEDTRRTGILLRHFGIATPTISFHAHNEEQKLPVLLDKLRAGQRLALVSDAGTPVVADPGQRLIAHAAREGFDVVSVPGASAILAALTVSGFPADDFSFRGFVPSRSNDRKKWLAALASEHRPVVFFEAPHRIHATLAALSELLVNRPIVICRELTKLHEQVVRSTTASLAEFKIPAKGEFTLVLGPEPPARTQPSQVDDRTIYDYFYHLTNKSDSDRRSAVAATGRYFGLSTKVVYSAVERAKKAAAS